MPIDRLEALSPKTRWDLEDVLGRVSEAISQENEVEEAEMEDGDTEGWPGD